MNKQIAGEIAVSEITVRIHRGNVMRKMGAMSLAELVRMADALGVRRTKPRPIQTNVCLFELSRASHCLESVARQRSHHHTLHAQWMGHLKKVSVISIVDDDESVRTATNSLMRSLGFTAYTFASAEEFLRSPHVNDTSCLISDVQMPNMSGIELQSHLVARGQRTPIIFITAFPAESIQARALNAGAVCFLNKPVDGKTLLRCLEEALKRPEDGIA